MNKILVFTLFFLNLSVFSQNTKRDSIAIQKIINKYSPKKEIQKVITISDSDEVNLIRDYIVKKNIEKAKIDENSNIISNSRIGKRYSNGDKSVISEIERLADKFTGEDYTKTDKFYKLNTTSFFNEPYKTMSPFDRKKIFDVLFHWNRRKNFIMFLKMCDYIGIVPK
jgi:hypothetical protein